MRYVLNSAVISHPGHYEYKLLTGLEAELVAEFVLQLALSSSCPSK